MENAVNQFIINNNLFGHTDLIGVAVSGGVDSMTLLYVLRKLGYKVFAVHFEHGIRGLESKQDEIFVREYCADNGVEYVSGSCNVPEYASICGLSIETAARIKRYEFFNSINASVIAVAHHIDDQIETILQHIIRGTGIKGLRGMLPVNGRIVRPFLHICKSDIVDYAVRNGIPYIVDASNLDRTYTRNKIRCDIIPEIKNINPNAGKAFLRMAESAFDVMELIEYETEKCGIVYGPSFAKILKSEIVSLNPVVAQNVLYKMFCSIGQEVDIESEHIKQILALSRTGSRRHIKNGCYAMYDYGWLVISKEKPQTLMKYSVPFCDYVSFPYGVIKVADSQFNMNNNDKNVESFAHIPPGSVVRNRKNGDIFKPLGCGTKKLADYFIDKKIPSDMRDVIPLLAIDNQIIWVVGHAISDDYKVTDNNDYITLQYIDNNKKGV